MDSKLRHTTEDIRRVIEGILAHTGLLFRVFARGKTDSSIKAKLLREPGKYEIGKRLIQDAIGVRIVLYFEEDVNIVEDILAHQFNSDLASATIDSKENDRFTVMRHNLVYSVPSEFLDEFKRATVGLPIDSTFEVQLRTVLSEGWHEVDHDLRYKSKESWNGQDDLSRTLNGVLATLETADWGMKRIFDELAYRHYKDRRWALMLHNKLRMRVVPELSNDVGLVFDKDLEFAKNMLRIDRRNLVKRLCQLSPKLPVSLDNLVFLANFLGPKNRSIESITPSFVLSTFSEAIWVGKD